MIRWWLRPSLRACAGERRTSAAEAGLRKHLGMTWLRRALKRGTFFGDSSLFNLRLEEEADGGYAVGSGGEALGGVLEGDAAKGEEAGVGGEVGGLVELVEAEAGGNELAVDAFFEDGAEEEEVEAGGVGGDDLGEGVAGGADDGGGAAGVGEGGVDPVEVLGGGSGGEVDAVGAGGDGDFDGTVEEEPWG